jgi:hypothetical protein
MTADLTAAIFALTRMPYSLRPLQHLNDETAFHETSFGIQ